MAQAGEKIALPVQNDLTGGLDSLPGCCKKLAPLSSGSFIESVSVMQQFVAHSLVGAQRQGKSTLRSGKSACPLDELATQSVKPFEMPERRALRGRATAWLVGGHL